MPTNGLDLNMKNSAWWIVFDLMKNETILLEKYYWVCWADHYFWKKRAMLRGLRNDEYGICSPYLWERKITKQQTNDQILLRKQVESLPCNKTYTFHFTCQAMSYHSHLITGQEDDYLQIGLGWPVSSMYQGSHKMIWMEMVRVGIMFCFWS